MKTKARKRKAHFSMSPGCPHAGLRGLGTALVVTAELMEGPWVGGVPCPQGGRGRLRGAPAGDSNLSPTSPARLARVSLWAASCHPESPAEGQMGPAPSRAYLNPQSAFQSSQHLVFNLSLAFLMLLCRSIHLLKLVCPKKDILSIFNTVFCLRINVSFVGL